SRLIASAPPGQLLDIKILRAGRELTVGLTVAMAESDPNKAMAVLGHAPEDAKRFATPSAPGFDVSAIGDDLRKEFALRADQNGVVVTRVDPKGVAADRKVVIGDIILAVAGTSVSTP